jgi:hypothetical protein
MVCTWIIILIIVACIGFSCLLYILFKKTQFVDNSCSCVNGNCIEKTSKESTCICDPGWSGKFCNTPEIYCAHGTAPLTRPTVCSCDNGWTGSRCEEYAKCLVDDDCKNVNMNCVNKHCSLQTSNNNYRIDDCKIPDGIQYPTKKNCGYMVENHINDEIKKYCSFFSKNEWKIPFQEDLLSLDITSNDELQNICNNLSFNSCNDDKQLKGLQYLYTKYGNTGICL